MIGFSTKIKNKNMDSKRLYQILQVKILGLLNAIGGCPNQTAKKIFKKEAPTNSDSAITNDPGKA